MKTNLTLNFVILFCTLFVFLRIAFLNKMQPLGKTYVPTDCFIISLYAFRASCFPLGVSCFPVSHLCIFRCMHFLYRDIWDTMICGSPATHIKVIATCSSSVVCICHGRHSPEPHDTSKVSHDPHCLQRHFLDHTSRVWSLRVSCFPSWGFMFPLF